MIAVISGPKYWREIDQSTKSVHLEILYRKIDRDIDIMEETEKIIKLPVDFLILDISCIDNYNAIPDALSKLKLIKSNIRIIIISPFSFSGSDIMNKLISMEIYDIIGQADNKPSNIAETLVDLIHNPSTYAKSVKWDKGIASKIKRSNEFIDTGKGRFDNSSEKIVTVKEDRIIGTVVIAVAGCMNRIGTTHTAISMAKFLYNNKHGVAIVEHNYSETFNTIKKSYRDIQEKEGMFSLSGIDFYPYNPELTVSDLIHHDYSYVILDMGCYENCDDNEFRRAGERIIVCGGKDWEVTALESLLLDMEKPSTNKYFFNFCSNEMFKFIQSNMESLDCYQAPFNPQPFEETNESIDTYEKLLINVLPQSKEDKFKVKKSIFKKKSIISFHKPILLKKIYESTIENKDDFSKFVVNILVFTLVIIVIGFIVFKTPFYSYIKEILYNNLMAH